MELNDMQKRVIYNAVRYWQMNRTVIDGVDYNTCSEVLDKLFPEVYTQRKEQPT